MPIRTSVRHHRESPLAFPRAPAQLVRTSRELLDARLHDRHLRLRYRGRLLARYDRAAAELIGRVGSRYPLRAPGTELLESGSGEGASMVISEWPDKAAAKAFWTSPEYAEAKKLRGGLADCRVRLIEARTIDG